VIAHWSILVFTFTSALIKIQTYTNLQSGLDWCTNSYKAFTIFFSRNTSLKPYLYKISFSFWLCLVQNGLYSGSQDFSGD
jgi:hypothetical protein